MVKTVRYIDSPCGRIGIVATEHVVTHICFDGASPCGVAEGDTPLLAQAACELEEYFAGHRQDFTFPIEALGTPFQQQVWQALSDIPYGQTRTYAQIAAAIGRPRACRAVGMANNRNPLPIVIPCHRVVGADGSLTGYAGGVDMKESLLRLECR